MKAQHFLILFLLVGGCSSGEKSGDKSGSNSGFKMPENVADMTELNDKYANYMTDEEVEGEETYDKLIGNKVTIVGTVENISFSPSEEELYFWVSNGKDFLEKKTVSCYFKSTDILNQCLPGQKVVIEGTICEKNISLHPPIDNCKLLNVEGDPKVSEMGVSELDAGKKYSILDGPGVFTGKVKKVVESKSGDHVYVDIETKQPMCIHFNAFKHPDAKKFKALKPGDSIRAIGTSMKSAERKDYDGKTVLYNCHLLK